MKLVLDQSLVGGGQRIAAAVELAEYWLNQWSDLLPIHMRGEILRIGVGDDNGNAADQVVISAECLEGSGEFIPERLLGAIFEHISASQSLDWPRPVPSLLPEGIDGDIADIDAEEMLLDVAVADSPHAMVKALGLADQICDLLGDNVKDVDMAMQCDRLRCIIVLPDSGSVG